MNEFTASQWSRIKGHGFLAHIDGGQLPADVWDPSMLVGFNVLINGEEYRVDNVEKFMIGVSPQHPYTLAFGILVK